MTKEEIEAEELRLAIYTFKKYLRTHPEAIKRETFFMGETKTYQQLLEEMEKGTELGKQFAGTIMAEAYKWGELPKRSTIPDALADYLSTYEGKITFITWGPRPRHMEINEIVRMLKNREKGYEDIVAMYLQSAFERSGI